MRAALLFAAGCSFHAPPDPGPAPDGNVIPGCVTFSSQLDTCMLPATQPVELSGTLTFDTNTGALFRGATPIAVDTLTIATADGELKAIVGSTVVLDPNTQLRADGARGFAIVATEGLQLMTNAVIDVSNGGAGALPSCQNGPLRGTDRDGGASGGGGGALGGTGGAGGSGDTNSITGGVGGLAISLPAGVRGGCPGADGGNDNNDNGGSGGRGGGAVYLLAATRLELAAGAGIDAGGGGGGGGHQHGIFFGDAGGGGGGSGGMIVLEAPAVASSGTLAANGGGGGEASGGTASGNDGAGGGFDTLRAPGGNGNSGSGTDGGDGGALPGNDGVSVTATGDGGGGGGGGGAGFVRIVSPAATINTAVSPSPTRG